MRGHKTVHFKGGCLDGTFHDNFPAQLSGKPVHARRGVVAVKVADGVEIRKLAGDKPIPVNWLSYNVDVYLPTGETTMDKGQVYTFSETMGINRCESLTLKDKQCRNEAMDGHEHCKTHRPK